jgi:L-serine deaminase
MAPKIWAYNWAYIFESVIVRPLESCLAGDLRVRRFVPESRDSLVSSESDSAALAPLQ